MFVKGMRENLDRAKKHGDSKSSLADKFNVASEVLIDRFMKDVMAGSVEIDGVTDLMRLFQIYQQVNEIGTGDGEGTGRLPSLTRGQQEQLEEYVSVKPSDNEDDESVYIDMEELASLTPEAVEAMMAKREQQVNRDNEDVG